MNGQFYGRRRVGILGKTRPNERFAAASTKRQVLLRHVLAAGLALLVGCFACRVEAQENDKRSSLYSERSKLVWLELGVAELRDAAGRLSDIVRDWGAFGEQCESECKPSDSGSVVSPPSTPQDQGPRTSVPSQLNEEEKKMLAARQATVDQREKAQDELRKANGRIRAAKVKLEQSMKSIADAEKKAKVKPEDKTKKEHTSARLDLSTKRDEVQNLEEEARSRENELDAKRAEDRAEAGQKATFKYVEAGKEVERQVTLLEHFILKGGPREIIDRLLKNELANDQIAAVAERLVEAGKIGDAQLVRELLRLGADVGQLPGKYSALAYSRTFGYQAISSMLIANGAWVETPWDSSHSPSPRMLLGAADKQCERLGLLSRSIDLPHDSTKQVLACLRCRIDALKKAIGHLPERARSDPMYMR